MRKSWTGDPLRRSRALVTACALAVAAGACGDGGASSESTESVSQDLLSSMPSTEGAMSQGQPTGTVPMPPAQERPTIDVVQLGFDRGSAEAPIRVVEMSDYGCGYCRKFHLETWPTLREQFVEEGKVEWKFVPFVTGMFQNSLAATRAAECTLAQDVETFEAMNEALWEKQSEWKGASEPEPVLRGMAETAGADMGAWDTCVAEQSRDERIAAATALSRQVGVRGTPTFFVVGYPPLQGALPTETFVRILDMVHADATQGGGM